MKDAAARKDERDVRKADGEASGAGICPVCRCSRQCGCLHPLRPPFADCALVRGAKLARREARAG